MKDNFSTQSDKYAKYRPGYPAEFFDYLYAMVPVKESAWDCGTGNGQIAIELAKRFEEVFATDISQSQLDNAIQAPNIYYSQQPAEITNFENEIFDLVTVGQAIHWFDFDKFYAEVRRTTKKNALICLVGYGGVDVSEEINKLKKNFYTEVVGAYWDKERKYVDDNYTSLPFPFEEIQAPAFENKLRWDLEKYIGYVNTWSAVKKFIKENGFNPIEKFQKELEVLWERGEVKEVRFPLMIRLGSVSS
jgi:hypothetical protein